MARKPLKDDEGYLASWDQMTAAEKARVRAREKAELEKAKNERKRPLSSRIMDGLFTPLQQAKKTAAEDTSRRESRYQDAKKKASQSDKDRSNTRYGVDRPVKISNLPFAKGGSASKRGDGCATKGKTRGKVC